MILVATMVMGVGIMSHAASGDSASVTLKTSQYSSSSAVIGDSYAVSVKANNASSSKHKVKVITYAAPAGGSWYKANTKTLDVGTNMPATTIKGSNSTCSYYLNLNVNLAYKNCSATGTITLK